MAKDNLRQALKQAGIQPDELADIVGVDARSVRRWLSGITPRPRQRAKIAGALDTTEHQLWPDIVTAPAAAPRPVDPVVGFASIGDLAAPDWKTLLREATEQIELVGSTLSPVLGTPGLPDLLAAKAKHGCQIRILTSNSGPHLKPFLKRPGTQLRALAPTAHQTLYRFDDQLLLAIHLPGEDDQQAPLLHVRRAAPGGLFDRLADSCRQLWTDGRPITSDTDPDHQSPQDGAAVEPDQIPIKVQRPIHRTKSALASPRRWPGRTQD